MNLTFGKYFTNEMHVTTPISNEHRVIKMVSTNWIINACSFILSHQCTSD